MLFCLWSVVRQIVPRLRDRLDDVPPLIQQFLKAGRFNQGPDGQRRIRQISRAALDRLLEYEWPGNVRELHNVVERAVSFADGDTIELRDLPDHIAMAHRPIHEAPTSVEKGPAPAAAAARCTILSFSSRSAMALSASLPITWVWGAASKVGVSSTCS